MSVVFLNLLFIDSIFAGISKTMDDGKINFQYGEVIIEPQSGEKYIKNANDLIDKMRDYYYIKSITSHLRTTATLINDKNNDGRDIAKFTAGVIAINPKKENKSIDFKTHLIAGRYLKSGEKGKAMLGADLAGGYGSSVFPDDLEGVRIGDTIQVQYNNDGGLTRDYEIVGIYKTKNFDTDSKMIVTKKDLNSVLGTTNQASEIIFRLKDRNLSKQAIKDIKNLHLGNYDLANWNDKLAFGRTINKSFEMIGTILRIIGSLVAGLVIFIIIFVDIVNRRRQIGILKAIGIPEQTITYSYIIRGMFYTALGILFGYSIMIFVIIPIFTIHPINFPMGDMIPVIKTHSLKMSIILFLVAGFIGSLLPASKEIRKKILVLMK